ncbi:hypothetical protein HPB49_019200 [Dermacentor silvarum]|uniref:Uncharacterized protein n=1 Tax=Dermacentor silvarum TaxID=543639 RepID=A0ACB8DQW5_DERSI|nr:hypothetical protein HPB49_019200 [Dermacentor silvarum]
MLANVVVNVLQLYPHQNTQLRLTKRDFYDGIVEPTDPEATFYNSCGVLVVHPATHERLLVHNAKVDNVEQSAQQPNATLAAQPAFAPESLHSVAAALVADPSFTTAIAAAVAASNPTMKEVCELHFVDEDIIRDATHTDQATGRVMTVPLSHVRLRPDAVPSEFPNHSSYLSRKAARREDPDSKRARIENAALQKAISESNEAFIRAREEDKVNSVSELANHLRSQGMKFWDVIERNERLLLIHIVDDEAPWLKYSVCVKGDLSVTLHVMKTARCKSLRGNITGAAINRNEAANCALVFMVRSVTCKFKEVAHIVPVHRVEAEFLQKTLKDVICGLEKIGYRVMCIVSNNNSVNRKAMSLFESPPCNRIVYQHPSDPSRPLFFVIDPVHILKCIRNNWINQKNDQICFYFPDIQGDAPESERMQTADLHSKECDQLLKYGYGLSRKALYPSSLERQDVKLALQIFNDYLPEALRALGAKHNLFSFEATATFVEIILKWWKIVNVKTPWKGERLRDHFQQPVLSIDNDPKIDFLHMFLKWLDEWKNKGFDNGTLTKETHAALEHTTYALVELARQIYEVENKLRLQSTLPTVSPDQHWECVRKQVEALLPSSNVVVTSQALTKMQDVVPVLVYVAGYAVYGTLKKLKCEQCRDSLTVDKKITVSATNEHYGLVKQLDRAGLVYPSMFALNAVAHSYVVVEQLATEPALLMMPEQRQVVTKMTLQLLASEEQSDFDTCENGHTVELVLKHILRCSTNILLKNFCRKLNDKLLDAADKSKKRKATTLEAK